MAHGKYRVKHPPLGIVLRLKRKIQEALIDYEGEVLTAGCFGQFVQAVYLLLPAVKSYAAVFDSLEHLVGQRATSELLEESIWRLVGNLIRLQNGDSVFAWSSQVEDELVPFQILSVEHRITEKRRKRGGQFYCRALAGSPCPLVIPIFWTLKFCSWASQQMGFSAPWRKHPFRDVFELVNMRFHGLVLAEKSKEQPVFEEIVLMRGDTVWNKRLLIMRSRTGRFRCPHKFPDDHPCHLCFVGLEQCPAAVHEQTYYKAKCRVCKLDTWFDPAHPSWDCCIDCHIKELLKHGKTR